MPAFGFRKGFAAFGDFAGGVGAMTFLSMTICAGALVANNAAKTAAEIKWQGFMMAFPPCDGSSHHSAACRIEPIAIEAMFAVLPGRGLDPKSVMRPPSRLPVRNRARLFSAL